MKNEKLRVLRQFFGSAKFRPGQEEAIDAILRGRDVLCVMPTGAGKSLCYELPALLLPGTTLVVSPLIALMKDQTGQLARRGIPAAALHSGLSRKEIRRTLQKARQGKIKLLYLSPERLRSSSFRRFVKDLTVPLLVVDEAHCVLSWGREFRPAYRAIPDFLPFLGKRPVVAALTATASFSDQEHLAALLTLSDPVRIRTGFFRPNLSYSVRRPADKFAETLSFIENRRHRAGILYCRTRRSAEMLASRLLSCGISCAAYHAGLPADVRGRIQDDFLAGRIPVITATNAFGMGIDKKDVRFVVHYEPPLSMEDYYQEAGRAGRDGRPAECLLLCAPGDFSFARRFAGTSRKRAPDREKLRQVMRYAAGAACFPQFICAYFGESMSPCGKCPVCRGVFTDRSLAGKIPYTGLSARESVLYDDLLGIRRMLSRDKKIRQDRIISETALRSMARQLPLSYAACLFLEDLSPFSFLFLRYFLPAVRDHVYYFSSSRSR